MAKLQQMTHGQVFVIIPRQISRAMGWNKGDIMDVAILGKDKLKIERVKKTPPPNTPPNYKEN